MLALLFGAVAVTVQSTTPITLGDSIAIASPNLHDTRTVNVVLPLDYAKQPGRRWPVVYVIDGGVDQDLVHVAGTQWLGAMWGRNRDAIVVGIATKDRRAELVGPTRDKELTAKYPTAGGSAKFRAFIRDDVKPMVSARYRTNGEDVVIGESLAGLFILETWLREPSLFGGYGAVSPSLWWDKEALSQEAAKLVGASQKGHPLYLTVEREGEDAHLAIDRIVASLSRPGIQSCYAPRHDLTHATIYHTVSPTVLQYLLPPKEAPDPAFGFEVTCEPLSKSPAK